MGRENLIFGFMDVVEITQAFGAFLLGLWLMSDETKCLREPENFST
jgi:Kef-type K+ transport system membrane component KefB